MRTVGRRWPEGIGPDRQALCSYCGVQWRRSQLTRDASQNLACPDCAPGLDIVSLSEGNARLMRSQQPKVVGPVDGSYDTFICPPSPGFIDPNGPPAPRVNGGPIGEMGVTTSLWLRSDRIEQTIAGRIQALPDQSSLGNNCWAVSEAAQPVQVVGDPTLLGLPTVTSDGIAHWLRTTTFGGGAPLWAWLVFKPLDGNVGVVLGAGVELLLNVVPGTARLLTNAGQVAAVPAPIGQWSRAIVTFNIAGTDSLKVRGVIATDVSAGQRISPEMTLFSTSNGSFKSSVAFAEALLTVGEPSVEKIEELEAYGMARYGTEPFA